jgi:hypothetical protein
MGNVVIAVPQAYTNYSLRPFAIAGVGLLHVGLSDVLGAINVNSNLFALNFGGGVIGPLTPRTGVRFDIRYFRNMTAEDDPTLFGTTRLAFWRASAGVSIRY